MDAPYGLKIIESCLTCNLRAGRLFCDLPAQVLQGLEKIRQSSVLPASAIVFVEGQESRGVYVLCSGTAKLTTTAKDGKTIILKIAETGEVLGLSASVSNKPYEITAETLEPCRINYIPKRDFMSFLKEHGEACLRVASLLSNSYQSAYEEIRSLGLSNSIAQRVAKLLLDRADRENSSSQRKGLKFHLPFSHEEIGQMIGTSRETVTRVFSDFKKRKLIEVKGAVLSIPDRNALADLVNS